MPGIFVEILGNATQFKKELESAVVATEKANAGWSRMSKAAGLAGLALGGALAVGLDKSVKAAMDAEQQTARLSQAFTDSGVSFKAYSKQIENAEAASRKLGFANTDVRDALGSLIVATHNGTKAIADLSIAEDVARFKHTDLTSASKMLTMAMAGSQRAVKQLGLSVATATDHVDRLREAHKKSGEAITAYEMATAKAADKQETAAKVIDLVKEKLSGQSQAYSQTAAGGIAQFHAQTQALEENIGAGLLPALTSVTGALASLTGFLAQHQTIAKVLVTALATLATVLISVSVATKAWAAAQVLLNVALTANPIGVVVVAIAALAAGIIYAYTHSEKFRAIVQGAFNAVRVAAEFVLNFFRNNWPIIVTLISGPFAPIVALATNAFGVRSALTGAAEAIIGWFRSNWKTIAVVISGPFAPLVALATNAFGIRSALIAAFESVRNFVGGVLAELKADFLWFGTTGVKIWQTVSKALAGPLGAIQGLFQGIANVLDHIYSVIKSIIDQLGNLQGLVGKLGSIIGKIPGLQSGGPVSAGQAYIVGESGPELFIAGQDGMIVPNFSTPDSATFGAVGGGAGGTTVILNIAGSVSTENDLVDAIHDGLLRKQRRTSSLGFAT